MAESVEEIPTRSVRSAPMLECRGVELHVVSGPDRGKTCRLDRACTRIGSAAGNHFRLAEATVSRLHCEIRRTEATIRIIDTGSTNGTFVDGVRVSDAELVPGNWLCIGANGVNVLAAEQPYSVELSPRSHFGDMVGASALMRQMYTTLERVSPTDTTVLIQGETGTGKELVARAIHAASRRADAPFVVVDCGAIAENLMESELFGHVRGAFSGAVGHRRGLIEEAGGGTLFLDEIGELPLSLQPKLLRAIESLEVRSIGSNTNKRVDVRFLAATNRPLAQAVNDGIFREDLYYRLAVVDVHLPPLRVRREDIALLAKHFYRRFAGEGGSIPFPLLSSVMTRSWPGNVRELRNFIERSVSLGQTSTLRPPLAPPLAIPLPKEEQASTDLSLKEARAAWTEQFERAYAKAVLAKTDGNVTHAAELAGVNRRSLQRLIAGLGLRESEAADQTSRATRV